MSAQFLDC